VTGPAPKARAKVGEWDVTPGLQEWIEQHIIETERALRGLDKEQGRVWVTRWDARTDSMEIVDRAGSLVAANVLPWAAEWMERAAPTLGYARCAADRKILAAHPYTTRVVNPSRGKHSAGFGCETCHDWDGVPEGRGNCATILALAEAYGLEPAEDGNVEVVRD
jgi:hypothetical protein